VGQTTSIGLEPVGALHVYHVPATLSACTCTVVVAVALASWYSPPSVLSWIATGLAWLFLIAAPRPVLELLRRHSPGSDAAQLAALTHVHRYVWCLLWLVLTIGALVAGALWMVPGLYQALASFT